MPDGGNDLGQNNAGVAPGPYPFNAQLPAGARWVTPPTMANMVAGNWPTMELIDPSLYQGEGQGGQSTLNQYTDPTSGAKIPIVPWNVNPSFAGDPRVMGAAIPSGGIENLQAGTYADPAPSSGLGSYFNYDLASGTATPTPASLALSTQQLLDNRMSPAMSAFMGLPWMAMSAVAAPEALGLLGGLAGGLAGAGAATAGAGAGGATAAGGGSGLLSQALGAVGQLKPFVSAGQDILKIASAFNQPQPTPPASLLAQQQSTGSLLR